MSAVMVSVAVLISTFSSGIHTHPVSWNCAYHLRMELSDGGCLQNLVRSCRWTIVPRQSFWITLYIELILAESDWRQIGIAESAARPAVTRNGPSDVWCDLSYKIMPLYSSSYSRHTSRNRRGGGRGLGFQTPPVRNSEGPPKSCQTQPDCEKC